MGNVILILGIWFLVSFPVALIVGRFLAAANRETPEVSEDYLPEEAYLVTLSSPDNGV
jgi:hypothetical protein